MMAQTCPGLQDLTSLFWSKSLVRPVDSLTPSWSWWTTTSSKVQKLMDRSPSGPS